MTMTILLVLTMAALFCLLLTSAIILLTIAVVYCCCREPTVANANANVLLSTTNALPSVPETTAVPLLGKYWPPPMPTIYKETEHDMLWASFEVPACQQVKPPSGLLSINDSCGNAYMIMSGEPPAMPVIYEETEEDLWRDNFCVTPMTGKYRPPDMWYLWNPYPGDIRVGGPLLEGSAGYSRASISSCHYQHYAYYLCQQCILANFISNFENHMWHLQGLLMYCGTLHSQNGGGTNTGRVPNKKDHANKLIMGLGVMRGFGGDLGFGRQGMLLASFSFHLVSVRALTSLPLELRFGWDGEWGLSQCWRAPRGCYPLNCIFAAPRWWQLTNPGTNDFYHCILDLWGDCLRECGSIANLV